MNKIIEKNNQGAALLDIGHYKDALTVLNSGLLQLQSYLQSEGQESDDALEAAIISDASRTLFEMAPSEKTARRREESCKFGEDETSNAADLNQDFVYRRPIFITSESDCENETTVFIKCESDWKNEAALIVILVFNMALLHHLIALDLEYDDAKRPHILKGAIKLYKLGHRLQVEQESNVQLSLTYTMATVNNLAQIFKDLNNKPQSNRLFKHLLRSLMIIVDSGATNEVDEMAGFMGNASMMILRDCSFAAAA
jgi:hypothetical protein